MTVNQSDNESTIAAPSGGSIRREIQGMYKVIKKEKDYKNTTIIAVVRPGSLVELERKCQKRWWNILQDKSAVLVTTDDWLQATINDAKRYRGLTVLVSEKVDEISFDVHSHIDSLKILRCGDLNTNRRLLINGSSTFAKIRLDMWQAKSRKRFLWLGLGVQVKVELNGNCSWARSTDNLDAFQQEKLRHHLHNMGQTPMDSGWDKWRGTVAAILGLAVGTGKIALSMKAAVGGMYVKYNFGMHSVKLGAAGAKGSVLATAAGPAILLGAGVAAAVYFIPWDSVFDWLKSVIAWLWEGIKSIWARFQSWVASYFGSGVTEGEESFMPKPMRFSG